MVSGATGLGVAGGAGLPVFVADAVLAPSNAATLPFAAGLASVRGVSAVAVAGELTDFARFALLADLSSGPVFLTDSGFLSGSGFLLASSTLMDTTWARCTTAKP